MDRLTSIENIKEEDNIKIMVKPQQEEAETDVETPFNSPDRESSVGSPATSTISDKQQAQATVDDSDDASVKIAEVLRQSKSEEYDESDFDNWPLQDIREPHANDVLYGRGGGTNHHPGNKRYRKLVETRKVDYVNSKRLDKPLVALEIIKEWRGQKPPGRFLKLDEKTGLWHDVGERKAREKTSQALREKAPLLRKQQEEQRIENGFMTDEQKNTRFGWPRNCNNNKVNKDLSRVILARDHSLGRDYIAADDPVSVKGFNWESPLLDDISEVPHHSQSWDTHADSAVQGPMAYAVRGSGSSQPRMTNAPYPSSGHYPIPHSQQSFPPENYSENWSSQYPHDWRGYNNDNSIRRNYNADYFQGSKQGYSAQPSNMSHVSSAARYNNNDNFMHSWTTMQQTNSEAGYDSASYQSPNRMSSTHAYGNWSTPPSQTSPQASMNYYNNVYRPANDQYIPDTNHHYTVSSSSREDIPRPPVVKRDTSNKLKTLDTEPTKKRMNRQHSMSSVGEVTENDMKNLNDSLEQSSITVGNHPLQKPQNLKQKDRLDTIDQIIINEFEIRSSNFDDQALDDVVLKPTALTDNDRLSTLGTIDSEDRKSVV